MTKNASIGVGWPNIEEGRVFGWKNGRMSADENRPALCRLDLLTPLSDAHHSTLKELLTKTPWLAPFSVIIARLSEDLEPQAEIVLAAMSQAKASGVGQELLDRAAEERAVPTAPTYVMPPALRVEDMIDHGRDYPGKRRVVRLVMEEEVDVGATLSAEDLRDELLRAVEGDPHRTAIVDAFFREAVTP